MKEDRKYGSWDGQNYDTYSEMVGADNRWKQQAKQNQLLEEQNQLQAQMLEEQKQEREQKLKLEQERLENERLIEIERAYAEQEKELSRQEHNEKMRLLKLCDEIGISKSVVDKFISLLSESKEEYELKRKIEKLEDKEDALQYEQDDILYEMGKHDEYNISATDEIKILKELKLMDTTRIYQFHNSRIYDLFSERSELVYEIFTRNGGGLLFFLLVLYIFSESEISGGMVFAAIGFMFNIIMLIVRVVKREELKQEIISECDKQISLRKTKAKEDEKEAKEYKQKTESMPLLRKEEAEIRKVLNELYPKLKAMQEKNKKENMERFYNFRLNHYNPAIEKFLLDFELDKKINNDYKIITKSEAKSNGKIEDYLEYFLEKINEFETTKKEVAKEEKKLEIKDRVSKKKTTKTVGSKLKNIDEEVSETKK